MSIHPDHYFPNEAPRGHHMICRANRLMKGDICWNMSADTWGPIRSSDIGKTDTLYMRLARPDRNNLVNRAKRSKIAWQPMETANRACEPLLLKVEGRVVMGRSLSLGPTYHHTGWFLEEVYGWWTHKRIYPTAWAPLPEL